MRNVLWASISALALAGALAGCATAPGPGGAPAKLAGQDQFQSSIQFRIDEEARVDAIAHPVLSANEEFCDRKGVWLGLGAHSELDFPKMQTAAAGLGYGRSLRVSWVARRSPAAAAGVRVGDAITAIDGEAVEPRLNAWVETLQEIESSGRQTPVELTLDRGRGEVTAVVQAPPVCGYPILISEDSSINAFTDGELIYLNRGLIDFVRTDDELALVVAHEVAHNVMGHIVAQQANVATGAVGGLLLDFALTLGGVDTGGAFTTAGARYGGLRFSQDFENEADYVAMYYLARTGRSIEGVEDFWRRAAATDPESGVLDGTHPPSKERYLHLQATRDEITAKVRAGEELLPDLSVRAGGLGGDPEAS